MVCRIQEFIAAKMAPQDGVHRMMQVIGIFEHGQ